MLQTLTKTKSAPRVRFPEFKNAWERKPLNTLLIESKKRNYDGVYDKNDVLSVSGEYGIINQIEFQGRSFAGESVLNYHVVESQEIVYTKSPLKANPYGVIKYNQGKTGIVSTLYAVYKPLQKTLPKFLDYYFKPTFRTNNYLRPLVHKGAKNDMKISNSHVLDGFVFTTATTEQQKIADFLTLIDEKIESLGKKVELLKKYKKGIMEKIFSQEIRFIDEKGKNFPDWEEKKLRDFVKFRRGVLLSKADLAEEGKYQCILYGELFTEYTEIINSVKSKTNLDIPVESEIGDILMPTSDVTPQGLAKASAILIDGVKIGGDVNILKTNSNTDSIFLSYLLNFEKKKIMRIVSGTTVRHVYSNDLGKIIYRIPSTMVEQKRIADFLTSIDKKIEFEERRLAEAKKFKKFLLQNMFV